MLNWFRSNPVQAIATAAFVAGGLILLASDEFSIPFLAALGAVVFAVAPAAVGLQAIATGRFTLPWEGRDGGQKEYRGVGAGAWGLLFLLVSTAAAAYGIQQFTGSSLMADLLDRWPGLAVSVLGFALALFGLAEAGSASILLRGRERRATGLLSRIRGALIALLGLALLAAGLLHTLAPALFEELKTRLAQALLALLQR